MPLKQAWLLEQARLRQETPFGQAFGPATGVPPAILSLVERPIALGAGIILGRWSVVWTGLSFTIVAWEPAMPLWLSAKRVRVRGSMFEALNSCRLFRRPRAVGPFRWISSWPTIRAVTAA